MSSHPEKPDWKKSPNELREGNFRPRLWRNGGKPISKIGLSSAIMEADAEDQREDAQALPDLSIPGFGEEEEAEAAILEEKRC